MAKTKKLEELTEGQEFRTRDILEIKKRFPEFKDVYYNNLTNATDDGCYVYYMRWHSNVAEYLETPRFKVAACIEYEKTPDKASATRYQYYNRTACLRLCFSDKSAEKKEYFFGDKSGERKYFVGSRKIPLRYRMGSGFAPKETISIEQIDEGKLQIRWSLESETDNFLRTYTKDISGWLGDLRNQQGKENAP